MRTGLEKLGSDDRHKFLGVFVKYGVKSNFGFHIKTLLFKDIRIEGKEIICDHLWFSTNKSFEKLGELIEGDEISFNARVDSYLKGYKGLDWERQMDHPLEFNFKLSYPTNIEKVKK